MLDSALLQRDLAAVSELPSMTTILDLLCSVTGRRTALLARVTEETWTACAVLNRGDFDLEPGASLDIATTY